MFYAGTGGRAASQLQHLTKVHGRRTACALVTQVGSWLELLRKVLNVSRDIYIPAKYHQRDCQTALHLLLVCCWRDQQLIKNSGS
jgi:hypothetical protein